MKTRILIAAALGGALSMTALADTGLGGMAPPPPPPEPAPGGMPAMSGPAAPGGLLTSVNLNAIKAIFDDAKVPADVLQLGPGFSGIHSNLGGNDMVAIPVDCANNDQTGKCDSVLLLSGQWTQKMTAQQQMDYTWKVQQFSTVMVSPGGNPQLRYIFSVKGGVGPDYISSALVNFAYDMKGFGTAITTGKTPGSLAKLEPKSGVKNEPFSKAGAKVEVTAAPKTGGTGLFIAP